MTPGPGIEPGPHWWKASALTTTPTLLPDHNVADFVDDSDLELEISREWILVKH